MYEDVSFDWTFEIAEKTMTGLGQQQRFWTEGELAILRMEWANGLSGSQIGNLINRTRNSVIGKANRLKLEPRAPRNGNFYNATTGRQEKSKRRSHKKKGAVTPSDMKNKITAPKFYPADKPLTAKAPITIMELNSLRCHAVVGHGPNGLAVYCGDWTFGKSFCEGHCALYYDTVRTNRRFRA